MRAFSRRLVGLSRAGVSLFAATLALAQTNPPVVTPGTPPAGQVVVVAPPEEKGLSIDAALKEYTAKPGEQSCVFRFAVKNISKAEIVINQVRTSCGCTVAQLPSQPWKLAPGEGGEVVLTLDFQGKHGTLIKTATIDTATGYKTLTFKAEIPEPDPSVAGLSNRERNMQLATKNRQAVFQGDCARCHVAPTANQQGMGLYVTACAICHDAEHRASMVPDLRTLDRPKDRAYWHAMISIGKPGSLMPAFAKEHGGPLSPAQIDSLVEYLTTEFVGREKVKTAQ